jgi:DNA-binding transcriptional ArsR family regulator
LRRRSGAGAGAGAGGESGAAVSVVEERLRDADQVFGALAHATRRQVLLVLRFRGGSMTAGEIAERFQCTWPTTSRHLRVLEEAGLVRAVKRGRERLYELDSARLRAVTDTWLTWFRPAPTGTEANPPETARRKAVRRKAVRRKAAHRAPRR